jgi:hypothetical protein
LLERYNRHFNSIFPSRHPSLPVFCSLLLTECNRLVAYKRRVESGHDVPPEREPIEWPEIPKEYENFCPFEAQYLLSVSPSRATRSAIKRARNEAKKAKARLDKAVKRRRCH